MSERHPHRQGRISGKTLKDVGVVALGTLLNATRRLPRELMNGVVRAVRLAAPIAYYAPASPVRRAARDLALLTRGVPEGRSLFRGTLDRIARVARMMIDIDRDGGEPVIARVGFDPASADRLRALHAEKGAGVILVPHCVASILALGRLARTVPITLLYRGAPTGRRDEIQKRFVEALGIEHVPIRHLGERTVARTIIQATRAKRFVVGAADINRMTSDAVQVRFFGETAHLPAWPARFASRLSLPIVPATAALQGDAFVCCIDDPILEPDVDRATQAWASAFEGFVRRWPEDWGFLYDKRWSALVRRAAQAQPSRPAAQALA